MCSSNQTQIYQPYTVTGFSKGLTNHSLTSKRWRKRCDPRRIRKQLSSNIKLPYHKRSILQIKPKRVTFKSTNKTEFNNHKKNCIAQQSTNYPRYAESVQHSRVSQHNPLYINKLKRNIKWSYQQTPKKNSTESNAYS